MAAASTFDCKLNVQANQDFIDLFVQEMLTSVVVALSFCLCSIHLMIAWRLAAFASRARSLANLSCMPRYLAFRLPPAQKDKAPQG